MSRIGKYFRKTISGLWETFRRFALVPVFLAAIAVMVSLQIEQVFKGDAPQTVTRLIFAAIFGAFLCTAAQFFAERLERLLSVRWLLQAVAAVFTVPYYFLLTSPGSTNMTMIARLLVLCFALLAFFIWFPSFGKETFSTNALVHFKSFFISALYSVVLTLGLLAIYFAVNLLLFDLGNKIPVHIMNVMGTFFFPIYYLSLLPRFNSGEEKEKEKLEVASSYPKFLEILVSYIALPLITVFTAVLAVYLLKILVTLKWPVGELGPMVLGYSSVGLLLHILCGKLTNRFAVLYKRIFPIALIPLVCLQLYSVFIRVNAYGVTESRYYLVLFGIYSIVCALYLIATKNLKPGAIAIFAACFAIISVLPPIDAFSISFNSQKTRLESILEKDRMLVQGKLVSPGINVLPAGDKKDITNIMEYLWRMGYTRKLAWLPSDYQEYRDFDKVFGFGQTYSTVEAESTGYFNASLDQNQPLDISGYGTMLRASLYSNGAGKMDKIAFKLDGQDYRLDVARTENGDITYSIYDASGAKQAEVPILPFLEKLQSLNVSAGKGLFSPEALTLDSESAGLRVRIIFQYVSFKLGPDKSISGINGDTVVLVGKK